MKNDHSASIRLENVNGTLTLKYSVDFGVFSDNHPYTEFTFLHRSRDDTSRETERVRNTGLVLLVRLYYTHTYRTHLYCFIQVNVVQYIDMFE